MSRTGVARNSNFHAALRMAAASIALAEHLEQRPPDTIPDTSPIGGSVIVMMASERARDFFTPAGVCHFLNPSLQPRQREQTSDLHQHRPIKPRQTLSEC